MTAREALEFTLTFLLIALVALVLTYRADLSREVQKQAALVDSIEVLNAKLADAEAQATERLKGWRSESRSTPMPDSTWETRFVADPVRGTLALGKDRRNIARAILVDERGRVIVSPGADALREPEGVR